MPPLPTTPPRAGGRAPTRARRAAGGEPRPAGGRARGPTGGGGSGGAGRPRWVGTRRRAGTHRTSQVGEAAGGGRPQTTRAVAPQAAATATTRTAQRGGWPGRGSGRRSRRGSGLWCGRGGEGERKTAANGGERNGDLAGPDPFRARTSFRTRFTSTRPPPLSPIRRRVLPTHHTHPWARRTRQRAGARPRARRAASARSPWVQKTEVGRAGRARSGRQAMRVFLWCGERVWGRAR